MAAASQLSWEVSPQPAVSATRYVTRHPTLVVRPVATSMALRGGASHHAVQGRSCSCRAPRQGGRYTLRTSARASHSPSLSNGDLDGTGREENFGQSLPL